MCGQEGGGQAEGQPGLQLADLCAVQLAAVCIARVRHYHCTDNASESAPFANAYAFTQAVGCRQYSNGVVCTVAVQACTRAPAAQARRARRSWARSSCP